VIHHITEADIQKANQDYAGEVGISRESFARLVAFAISQPNDVDINEVTLPPTA